MAHDTLTLRLNGTVPLPAFAKALDEFNKLVAELSDEVVSSLTPIEWEIVELEGGSALTVIRGVHQEPAYVGAVVEAYTILAQALERRESPPYSDEVVRHATAITQIVSSQVTSVAFITDSYRAIIQEPVKFKTKKQYTLGVVSGFVRTITSRKPHVVSLGLFDSVFHQRVWCDLKEDQQEYVRSMWLKQVAVTGLIYRAPVNGRPLYIHDITDIHPIESLPPGSFRRAKGILPWREGDEPSEVIIRRIRDAS